MSSVCVGRMHRRKGARSSNAYCVTHENEKKLFLSLAQLPRRTRKTDASEIARKGHELGSSSLLRENLAINGHYYRFTKGSK